MLYFITMSDNKFTIELFLECIRDRLGFPAAILSYDDADWVYDFDDAVVIFCDIERFTEDLTQEALKLCDRILSGRPRRVLNNPCHLLRRFDLLKELHRRGINDFDVHRHINAHEPVRYPVFVRNELDHYGPVSDLLYSEEELADKMATARGKRLGPFSALITEYCDVRTGGFGFHKYGAFCLDGKVVPRHLFFSNNWMVKGTKDQLPEHIEIEKEYLLHNSFHEQIAEVFDIGHIGYGRVDFAKTKDGLAIFEINTNPTVLDPGDLESNRRHITDTFLSTFTLALQQLHGEP
jgi:hypothetical protein